MEDKHFRQALALIKGSKKQLDDIEAMYRYCLNKKEIDDDLLVVIKNYLENLRSSLEYCAQGLNEKYGVCKDKSKVSFPYAKVMVTKEHFIKRKYIENRIPGITDSRPDIANYIESIQHFSDPRLKWFPAFMSLTNTNKHIELTPHEKFEGVEMKLPSGASIVAKSISGTGTVPRGTTTTQWDEFLIKGVDWPLTGIEFLRHCQGAISGVVQQMAKM